MTSRLIGLSNEELATFQNDVNAELQARSAANLAEKERIAMLGDEAYGLEKSAMLKKTRLYNSRVAADYKAATGRNLPTGSNS